MTHDTQVRYDAEGLLEQMRSILDHHDAERQDIDDVNIYVGLMLDTLEQLWDVVGRSDLTSEAYMTRCQARVGGYRRRYQARACAAVVGDLCRQLGWDNAKAPTDWDTYSDTIRTIRWLLEVAS